MDNELLVLGNHERVQVECIENLGLITNVKVLAKLTNIIVFVHELQLMRYELIFRKQTRPVKIVNIESKKVIYGVLTTGVYWIHLDQVNDMAF